MNYSMSSVMTSNVIAVSEDRDINMAESLMKINNIRHLPVVNSNNELTGILSARDVAKVKDKYKRIKSIMTSSVQIVKKSDDIKTAIEIMLKNKICSVLVGEKDDIVGIITTDDLLKLLAKIIDIRENSERMYVSTFLDESWTSRLSDI